MPTDTDNGSGQSIEDRIVNSIYESEEATRSVDEESPEESDEDLDSDETEDEEIDESEVDEDEDEVDEEDDDEESSELDKASALALSKMLGIPQDRVFSKDGKPHIRAIIDGESSDVPVGELVKSYQLQGHVNKKSMAIEEDRRNFDAEKAKLVEEITHQVESFQNLTKIFEHELTSEFQGIDWDALRSSDPSEWSALRQDFAERAQRLKKAQTLAAQYSDKLRQEQSAKMQENHAKYLSSEAQKVLEDNPEWSDPERLRSDMMGIRNFLSDSYGFKDEDLEHVTDHRLVRLIKDAKKYHDGKKNAESKKVKTVPKFQKSKISSNAKSLKKARDSKAKRTSLRKSGSIQDAANLLVDRM